MNEILPSTSVRSTHLVRSRPALARRIVAERAQLAERTVPYNGDDDDDRFSDNPINSFVSSYAAIDNGIANIVEVACKALTRFNNLIGRHQRNIPEDSTPNKVIIPDNLPVWEPSESFKLKNRKCPIFLHRPTVENTIYIVDEDNKIAHIFSQPSLKKWFKTNNTHPVTRAIVTTDMLRRPPPSNSE